MNTENNAIMEDKCDRYDLTPEEVELQRELNGEFFRQNWDNTWSNKKGWEIRYEEDDSEFPIGKHCLYKDSVKRYESFSFRIFSSLFDISFQSYLKRKGRAPGCLLDMRIGPAHFSLGTVFTVNGYIAPEYSQYEVDHLVSNGPRSYVAVTKQLHKEGYFKDLPYTINISHARSIIKPGNGKMVVEVEAPDSSWRKGYKTQPSLYENAVRQKLRIKKGEKIVNTWRYAEFDTPLMTNPENTGKWIDDALLRKHLKSMGFLRTYTFANSYTAETVDIIKVKQASKWLEKNGHRVMYDLDWCCKEQKKENEKAWEDQNN